MPIINPTPTPPTPDQRLQQRANAFASQLNSLYRQINMMASQLTDFVWHNDAKTPQQMFDLYGTDAGDLVKISTAYAALIQTYTGTAPVITPPGFTVTVNSDGTVTITGG